MTTLDGIEKLIVRSVVENTIDQLAIVGGTIQLSLPSHGYQYANVHQNATNRPLDELILKENKQHQKLKKRANNNEMALKILSTEASYVQSVLEETLEEVEESGTFLALDESVAKSRERNKERNEIGEIEKNSREEMGALRESIEVAKSAFEEDVKFQNMEIANLKDALLEARRASKGQEIYTQQLENVREHESTRAMIKRENALVNEMNRLRTEIAHEQRVNMEVESWLRDRHTFLTNLHAYWTKKLRDDVAAKEAELQKLKNERANDKEAYLKAKQKHQEAKEYIDVAMENIRRDEAIKERRALETKSAIKIQSWWRMIMVRRCLGPYKKKKKAAPKDEKGNKKRK